MLIMIPVSVRLAEIYISARLQNVCFLFLLSLLFFSRFSLVEISVCNGRIEPGSVN